MRKLSALVVACLLFGACGTTLDHAVVDGPRVAAQDEPADIAVLAYRSDCGNGGFGTAAERASYGASLVSDPAIVADAVFAMDCRMVEETLLPTDVRDTPFVHHFDALADGTAVVVNDSRSIDLIRTDGSFYNEIPFSDAVGADSKGTDRRGDVHRLFAIDNNSFALRRGQTVEIISRDGSYVGSSLDNWHGAAPLGDGRFVLVDGSSKVKVWDPVTDDSDNLFNVDSDAWTVAVGADGTIAVAGTYPGSSVFDSESMSLVRIGPDGTRSETEVRGSVAKLAVQPDGGVVAAVENAVVLWHADGRQTTTPVPGDSFYGLDMALLADDQVVALNDEGEMYVIDLTSSTIVDTLNAPGVPERLVALKDQQFLVATSGGAVQRWDLSQPGESRPGSHKIVGRLGLTAEGSVVAIPDRAHDLDDLVVYDSSFDTPREIEDVPDGLSQRAIEITFPDRAVYGPAGGYAVQGGDGAITVWPGWGAAEATGFVAEEKVWALALLADGRVAVASSGNISIYEPDGSGGPVALTTDATKGAPIEDMQGLADGGLLSLNKNGVVQRWDPATGLSTELAVRKVENEGFASSTAVLANGLVAFASNRSVAFLDPDVPDSLRTVTFEQSIQSITARGEEVLVPVSDGFLVLDP